MKKRVYLFAFMISMFTQSIYSAAYQSTSGLFTVNLSETANADLGGVTPDSLFGPTVEGFLSELETMTHLDSLGGTMKLMADTQNMATRGLGTTYGTNHRIFIISGSTNFGMGPFNAMTNAINGVFPDFSSGTLPTVGLGTQVSAVIGVSFKQFGWKSTGWFKPDNIKVFANYFTLDSSGIITDPTFPDIKMDSFGFHVQYKLFTAEDLTAGFIYWGGVDVTTGIDVTKNSLSMPLATLIPTSVSSGTSNVISLDPTGSNISLESSAVTIPIEVSTSIRLLYALSFIAGLGVDINMGNSSLGTGPIVIKGSTPLGTTTDIGDASMTPQTAAANFADIRFFFGPQINLIPLAEGNNIMSISIIANISTDDTVGVNVALNMGF